MRTLRVAGAATLGGVLAAWLGACSEEDGPTSTLPPTTTSSTTTTTSNAGGGGFGGAGGAPAGGMGGEATGGAGASAAGGAGGAASGPLGTLPIEPIADTSCASKGGTELEVYPATAAQPAFNRLTTVGSHRAAQDAYVGGMWAMDMDGANAPVDGTFIANMRNWIASDGAAVSMVGVGELLHFQRFDEQGVAIGGLLDVSPDGPFALAVAARTDGALVAWEFEDTIRLRAIAADGTFSGPQLEVGSAGPDATVVAAAGEDGFAVAWAYREGPGDYRSYVLRTGLDGTGGTPHELTQGGQVHEMVRLVETPAGHLLLINGGQAERASYALLLDDQGERIGPAYQLLGADFVWDVASLGNELGLVATRSSGEPQFRAFDSAFAPLADWVCLGGATAVTTPSAIDADLDGYAVIYRTAADATNLARFDHLGTGP